MLNNNKGFSLTELIIALIILAIIALIAVPAYRSYVKKGIATEGKALLGEINAAQQIYYSRNGKFFAGTAGQQMSVNFGVDTRRNKYFTSYQIVAVDDDRYTATTEYDGQTLTVVGSLTEKPQIMD